MPVSGLGPTRRYQIWRIKNLNLFYEHVLNGEFDRSSAQRSVQVDFLGLSDGP